jgi:dihydrodipicolinate synthase/N-acetylneuraminate lyase
LGLKKPPLTWRRSVRLSQGPEKAFGVWSSNDSDTLPILALGGYGIISVTTHLVGLQIKDMIQHYLDHETEEAAAIHLNLIPLVKALYRPTRFRSNML